MRIIKIFFLLLITPIIYCQSFYFGNDLSYVNQMEDCGAVFKENYQPKDVYKIFADHGTNLVRVRLWVDPTWQNSLEQPAGVKIQYSDLEDVKETIKRSKDAGMQVLLDFHMSDAWADPGSQIIPMKWWDVAYNLEPLKDSLYNYVTYVLTNLENDTLMPEMVQIGNETNDGMMKQITSGDIWDSKINVSSSWSRHAELFNAAIQAVRDVSATTTIKPKIALHFAGLNGSTWWYNNIISNGFTNFDYMGLSYYYTWHGGSIQQLGNQIESLLSAHPEYGLIILETGYLWSTNNFDAMANIITTADPNYLPVSPEKQLEYMIDLTREVIKSEGDGVIFWEPAWVSTPCRTPWGIGSSHDHVAFFDPDSTNFMENGGGRWMENQFYDDPETKKVVFQVNMTDQDVSNGVYISGSWSGNWKIYPMLHEGNEIYSYYTFISPGSSGGFYFLNDNDSLSGEAVPFECADWSNIYRQYTIGNNDTVVGFFWGSCEKITSIENVNDLNKLALNISPNPSNGHLLVKFASSGEGRTLEIYNIYGRKINEYTCNSLETQIDISHITSGFYLFKILDNQQFTYRKIIIN